MAELELTIRIPVAGTMTAIPTREHIFTPGVAGRRLVNSAHVADVGGLASVELVAERLCIELKTGER
jgi:hypothetical protein